LRIGDYEDLKKASSDPYSALRDAYIQHRARKVR
jgi:phospholipid-binding lipoprotein MlaA